MDPEVKRKVLRLLTYGLYVLTARHEGEVAAATVNWLTQASFTPPLIVVAVKADSKTHSLIEQSQAFAVNILEEGQKEAAAAFFGPTRVEGDKINGYEFEEGPETRAPLLLATPAWFECRLVEAVKRGDHTIFIGEVVEAGLRREDIAPLELRATGWFYGG
jgi:flavin reductase (DIM6/NTAB) family NADH-FMN oxidoreductase RutF